MLKNAKNDSGQEAFGHRGGKAPVEQSPVASVAVVSVVWTSLGPLPRWVPGPTTRWAPMTTRLALHST
jgi:hypothetical protein